MIYSMTYSYNTYQVNYFLTLFLGEIIFLLKLSLIFKNFDTRRGQELINNSHYAIKALICSFCCETWTDSRIYSHPLIENRECNRSVLLSLINIVFLTRERRCQKPLVNPDSEPSLSAERHWVTLMLFYPFYYLSRLLIMSASYHQAVLTSWYSNRPILIYVSRHFSLLSFTRRLAGDSRNSWHRR